MVGYAADYITIVECHSRNEGQDRTGTRVCWLLETSVQKIRKCAKNITKAQSSRTGFMSHLLKRGVRSLQKSFALQLLRGEKGSHEEAFASKPEVDLQGKTATPCLSYSFEKKRNRY